jgi:hypothetical protein
MNGSLGYFLGASEKIVNEINLYIKNSSFVSEEYFNNCDEHNFVVLTQIARTFPWTLI